MKCPHCDVSLTEHADGRLMCHYCGYTTPKITVCPSCGSRYVSGFRAGTEGVEAQVKKNISTGESAKNGYGHYKRQGWT